MPSNDYRRLETLLAELSPQKRLDWIARAASRLSLPERTALMAKLAADLALSTADASHDVEAEGPAEAEGAAPAETPITPETPTAEVRVSEQAPVLAKPPPRRRRLKAPPDFEALAKQRETEAPTELPPELDKEFQRILLTSGAANESTANYKVEAVKLVGFLVLGLLLMIGGGFALKRLYDWALILLGG